MKRIINFSKNHKVFKKVIPYLLTAIITFVIGYYASLFANYSSKKKIVIRFIHEGIVPIGIAKKHSLENLELRYNNEKIESVHLMSWTIINENKGIGTLHDTIKVQHPEGLDIIDAKVHDKSKRLQKVDSFKKKKDQVQAFVNKEQRYIEIKNIESFNKNDYVNIHIFAKNLSEIQLSKKFYNKWTLFIDSPNFESEIVKREINEYPTLEELVSYQDQLDLNFTIMYVLVAFITGFIIYVLTKDIRKYRIEKKRKLKNNE
jgi:hypothetical protein